MDGWMMERRRSGSSSSMTAGRKLRALSMGFEFHKCQVQVEDFPKGSVHGTDVVSLAFP